MCTVIGLNEGGTGVVASNYDFHYHHGLALTNLRGRETRALGGSEPALAWRARFGSLTLNQFGRELPICGMNEAGLAVHLAQFDDGEYGQPSQGQPYLSELQWMQYQLDNFESVEEVIEALDEVAIKASYATLHYVIADRAGNLVCIEHVGGVRHVLRDVHRGAVIMTNHSVAESMGNRARDGHFRAGSSTSSSIRRLAAIAERVERRESTSGEAGESLTEFAVSCLEQVAQPFDVWKMIKWLLLRRPPGYTCWNTVFNCAELTLAFRCARRSDWWHVSLADLAFEPSVRPMCLDVETQHCGDVAGHFAVMTRDVLERVVRASYKPLRARISEREIEQLIDFPDELARVGEVV